jgi:hypothetical protein
MSKKNDSVGHVTNFTIGGISFISRRRGWAFDNVRNFEVSYECSKHWFPGLSGGNFRNFK